MMTGSFLLLNKRKRWRLHAADANTIPRGSEELDTSRVILPKHLCLAPLGEDMEGLEQQVDVETVELCVMIENENTRGRVSLRGVTKRTKRGVRGDETGVRREKKGITQRTCAFGPIPLGELVQCQDDSLLPGIVDPLLHQRRPLLGSPPVHPDEVAAVLPADVFGTSAAAHRIDNFAGVGEGEPPV